MTTSSPAAIRVVIVDDHALMAHGLAALLRLEGDIEVAGSASDIDSAHELIVRLDPAVVVCDIQVRDRSGFALLERLAGGPAFIMFSSHDHPAYHKAAVDAGAFGYVLKDGSTEALVDAIRAAAGGRASFSMQTIETLRRDLRLPSERELQIVAMVAAGASNDEIARDLHVRPKTIESHLRTLFDRYGVVSRTDLAMHAVNEGWIRHQGGRNGQANSRRPAEIDRRWLPDQESLGAVRGKGGGRGSRSAAARVRPS
jgi:DNA-binding NarL/FixJ family response regulator